MIKKDERQKRVTTEDVEAVDARIHDWNVEIQNITERLRQAVVERDNLAIERIELVAAMKYGSGVRKS